MGRVMPPRQHPAPWQVVIDGNGAFVIDKDRKGIIALSHGEADQISLWHRIVDAITAHEGK